MSPAAAVRDFAGRVRLNCPAEAVTADRLEADPAAWLPASEGGPAFLAWSAVDAVPPAAMTPQPLADGSLLCAAGRLDEIPDLPGLRDHPPSDDVVFAAAWERWGSDTGRYLYGEFALAHWDWRTRHLTLLRDALGGRALYYVATPHEIGFATSLESLIALLRPPCHLDERYIAEAIAMSRNDRERTFYRTIRRVPAGGIAVFDPAGHRTGLYWDRDAVNDVRYRRDSDYVEQGRELFDRAVAGVLPRQGPIVVELSGGFDSAGVAATAMRLAPDRPVIAVTRAPGSPVRLTAPGDPALAAHVAAAYPGLDWRIVDTDARDTDWLTSLADPGAVQPIGGAFAGVWFDALMRAVRDVAPQALLTGGVGNAVLSWGGQATGVMAAMRQVLVTRRLRGTGLASALTAGGLSGFRRPSAPLPTAPMMAPDFAAAVGHVRSDPWAAAGHDPVRLRIANLQSAVACDLRGRVWGRQGCPVLDPYRNRRLAEFALGVPDAQYRKDGRPRWLARNVLADRLPNIVLCPRPRMAQCPEWHALATAFRPASFEALSLIEASPLASRVLDVDLMRRTLTQWPATVASPRAIDYPHGYALHWALRVGMFLRRFDAAGPGRANLAAR